MKSYLFFWLTITGLLLLIVAVFNVVVDPYCLFRLIDKPGFNSIKPTEATHGAMSKAYQTIHIQPRGLILGNSRAEVGFDPVYPAWPSYAHPVLNLALPGTGTLTSLQYLQHALVVDSNSAAKLKVVIWGIDFMDFLVDASFSRHGGVTKQMDNRLLTNLDSSDNPRHWLSQVKDYTQSTFSLESFLDSVQTLTNQRNPYAVDLTPLGFNPMREYIKITDDEGYWNVFRQKDQENIRDYLRRPKDIYEAGGVPSPELVNLRQILVLCRQNGVALNLIIYPYHAHLLEIIRISGHWSAFEEWKRAVVDIVREEASKAGTTPVPIWDFSGFNVLTTEAVPEKSDRRTKMRWYWEAGHFKRELGNIIQDRVLGGIETIAGFGILLNTSNLDEHIISLRVDESKYRKTHSQEVADLERIASRITY